MVYSAPSMFPEGSGRRWLERYGFGSWIGVEIGVGSK